MKKHILLCVLGTSPQIVTETLYALMQKQVNVEEIHIITTTEGYNRLKETLIDGGILQKFINDYKLKKIKFDKENIYLIADDKNRPIKDIRTILENEIAGEFIFKIVEKLTNQQDTVLHCSIAGGRKTMGFYLGSALQIYGRKDDKLYHVLVNEDFEANPEFFYPPPKPVMINVRTKDGKTIKKSTEEAKIELAELPFIRLKHIIDLSGKSFRQITENIQNVFDNFKTMMPLILMDDESTIKIGDIDLNFGSSLFKIYFLFVNQKKNYCIHPERFLCGDCTDCFLPMKSDETVTKSILGITGKNQYDIRSKISKINTIIKEKLRDKYSGEFIQLYQIQSIGYHGKKRYGLFIDKLKIGYMNQ